MPAPVGWIANENTRLSLVADGPDAIDLAVMSLARIGIDTVEGTLAVGLGLLGYCPGTGVAALGVIVLARLAL